jgi:formylglycine-generating enzyme required for sulfatase activity
VTGGTYSRSNDARFPATVSDFRLDTYEISVGRYRKFVAAYPGSKPAAGAGKNPNDPSDKGWDAAWDAKLPATRDLAIAGVKCAAAITYTDGPGPNDGKPVSCLDWYTAQAFCIWDGGRLPTEAEWNHAAAGGAEQRVYPWSSPPASDTVDATFAVFAPPATAPATGGSKSPKGDGKFGQADLGGNVWEWTVDFYTTVGGAPYGSTYSVNPCKDCADFKPGASRVIRGGAYDANGPTLQTIVRNDQRPDAHAPQIGARCARSP